MAGRLCNVFIWFTFSYAVIVREYNRPNFFEFNSLQDLENSNFFSNGIASQNVLLGLLSAECEAAQDLTRLMQFRGIQSIAGKVSVSIKLPAAEYPIPMEDGRHSHLLWFRVGDSLRYPRPAELIFSGDTDKAIDWIYSRFAVTMHLRNDFDVPLRLYWHEESKSKVPQGLLAPGDELFVDSYLGHVFSATRFSDEEEDERLFYPVDYFVFDGRPYHFSPANRLETCDNDANNSLLLMEIACQDMSLRFDAFAHRVWMDKRVGNNFVQPQEVPAVTDDGFRLVQLPSDTFDWLRVWYDDRKGQIAREEGHVGPCMNQHAAPSLMVQLSVNVRNRLSAELQGILESWYGKGPLELTSIYGISRRKYTNNSVLRMHVDTRATHVVSAIINVDQDVQEPWKLLILDHAYEEHWVEMQPGDMLLYESAKLLHGRPEPMNGRRYENLFIHYKPTTGWLY